MMSENIRAPEYKLKEEIPKHHQRLSSGAAGAQGLSPSCASGITGAEIRMCAEGNTENTAELKMRLVLNAVQTVLYLLLIWALITHLSQTESAGTPVLLLIVINNVMLMWLGWLTRKTLN
ncbi:hypothetical protein [Oricola sp.]|uniref:hypothetical protein n=1 Tax=Oricola sp. TaxID=1979950 RepID=UPI0025E4C1CF|nr:hypothetical protein [Oricola sp.]MCI5076853.1 hypothetical protein [Oricola sp.]